MMRALVGACLVRRRFRLVEISEPHGEAAPARQA
jgi:hypothetical protein